MNRDELRAVEMPAANGMELRRRPRRLMLCRDWGYRNRSGPQDPRGPDQARRTARGWPARQVLHVETALPWSLRSRTAGGALVHRTGRSGSSEPEDHSASLKSNGVGYGYVMNKMGFHLSSDPRNCGSLASSVVRHPRREAGKLTLRGEGPSGVRPASGMALSQCLLGTSVALLYARIRSRSAAASSPVSAHL